MSNATEAQSEELVRALIDDVVNDHDFEAVKEVCAEDVVVMGGGSTHEGVTELISFFEGVESSFPDFAFDLKDLLVDGNQVAFQVEVSGTHEGDFEGTPPTGEEFSYPAVFIGSIEDGEISELVFEANRLSLLNQLGILD